MTTNIFSILLEIILSFVGSVAACYFFFEFSSIAVDFVSGRVFLKKNMIPDNYSSLGFLKCFFFDLVAFFSCLLACIAIFMLYRKWCEACFTSVFGF